MAKKRLTPSGDVAIVGIGCRFPQADDANQFWQNIRTGHTSFSDIPRDRWDHRAFYGTGQREVDKTWTPKGSFISDVKSFAALHYGISPRQLEVMDPQYRLLIESTREAIQDAGYELRDFNRARTGVFSGISVSEYKNLLISRIRTMQMLSGSFGPAAGSQELRDIVLEMTKNVVPMRAFSMPGVLVNMGAATISQTFDFTGPSFVVDAACAAGAAAVYNAVMHLRTHMVDTAVAGGAYVNLCPDNLIAFTRVGAISPTGACRPFDKHSDGFVQSDGVGMVFLKRLEDAQEAGDRIYAVIRGAACNNDGRGVGSMAPRVPGQLAVLRAAYEDAELSPATISYFECHGTGTAVGDPVEVEALGTLLKEAGVDHDHAPLIGSVKGNIGHAMSAAGVAGLIKAIKVVEHRTAPPQAGFTEAHPALKLDEYPVRVSGEAHPITRDEPIRVSVSALGFGGTNVHLVLEEPPDRINRRPRTRTSVEERPQAILISAPSVPLLAEYAKDLKTALTDVRAEDDNLEDIAFTLNATRRLERLRLVLSVGSKADLISQLEDIGARLGALDPKQAFPLRLSAKLVVHERDDRQPAPKVAFLFPGQGAQRTNILAAARTRLPGFVDALSRLEKSCDGMLERPLSSYIYPRADDGRTDAQREQALTDTKVCQPAMAALSLALCRALNDLGVTPSVSLGHSLGEFVALSSGGVLDAEETVRLVAERGRLMSELSLDDKGAMAAIEAPFESVKSAIDGIEGVWLANLNHPRQVSISGTTKGVDEAVAKLETAGFSARRLSVSHAFHSPLLAPINEKMAALIESLELRAPEHTVASCIEEEAHGSDLAEVKRTMLEHATAPVDFVRGLQQAKDEETKIFVQLGAGSTLLAFARATLGTEDVELVSMSPIDDDGGLELMRGLMTLAALGVPLDRKALYPDRKIVDLPPTPLERQKYWLVKLDQQLVSTLTYPIPEEDEGFGVVDIKKDAAAPNDDGAENAQPTHLTSLPPETQSLVSLFEQQNALLKSHADIIAAQTQILLSDPGSRAQLSQMGSILPTPSAVPQTSEVAHISPERATARMAGTPPTQEAKGGEPEKVSALEEQEHAAAQDKVLDLVSAVSAFPKDSIRVDQKLVDELGFDSIMVADLVRKIEKTFPQMDTLPQTLFSRKTTVGDLSDHVTAALSAPAATLDTTISEGPLSTYRVEATSRPRAALKPHTPSKERWLIVEDESPLADAVAKELTGRGVELLRVELVDGDIARPEKLVWGSSHAWPTSDLDMLAKMVLRDGKRLDGYIHLASNATLSKRKGFSNPVTVLHPLVRSLHPKRLSVVTALGGKLGLESSPALAKNGSQAGLLGYTKALAWERPHDLIRAIDIDPDAATVDNAKLIVDEVLSGDACAEVGFAKGERFVPRLARDTNTSSSAAPLKADDVVLITGGTGDIGRIVAKDLASASPKAVILAGRRQKNKEIEALLSELSKRGTKALYVSVDISDESAVKTMAEQVSKEVGPISVVLHAAGLIEDAAVENKTLESVERVMDVKVLGLGALLGTLSKLRLLVLFSSWAGRFGNAGQTDYAAANELIDRVAILGANKTRVLAVDWPPWSSTKMVETIPKSLKAAMQAQGVTFVDDGEGVEVLRALMASDTKGIRVVGREIPVARIGAQLSEELRLDTHPYLDHHRLRNEPVLPLASAADLIAHTAKESLGLTKDAPYTIENLELVRGVTVDDSVHLETRVSSEHASEQSSNARGRAEIGIRADDGAYSLAYRAEVRSGAEVVEVVRPAKKTEKLPFSVERFYKEHTFHGPLLQGIDRIETMSEEGIVGWVKASDVKTLITNDSRSDWAIDPVLVDSSFQLAGYWAFAHHEKAGYPIGFSRLSILAPFPTEGAVRVTIKLSSASEDSFRGNIWYEDKDGRLLAALEGIEGRFESVAVEKTKNGTGIPAENYDVAQFPEVEALDQRLEMAKLIGLENPYFPIHEGTAKNRSVIGGVEMLNYSSYNYLGFSGHPEVNNAVKDAIDRYGTSVSASRIASGERPIHRELELGLAKHVGVDDAIVYVSGHATNVMTVGHMFNSEDIIFHDSLIHDSILAGIRLSGAARRPYPHEDLDALERVLKQLRGSYRRALICTEGIYSMDGDICNLPRLIELKKKYKCMLLVDEAHSVGVLGKHGEGVGHHFEGLNPRDVDMWMGTLSKSFSSCGGYIAGSDALVRYLKYTAGGFVYSVGITPGNAAAALKSLELMHRHPEVVERLRTNSKLFLDYAKERGINTGIAVGAAVVPAIVGNSMECLMLSANLAKRKINVQPIVYPAVEDDAARLRFFISALHTEAELRHTVDVLAEELEKVKQQSASSGMSLTL